ncbi:hypothetical protein FALB51S_04113 [Frigidibacter albus]
MVDVTQETVSKRCRNFVEATAKGIEWIEGLDDATLGPSRKEALARSMRRTIRRGQKLGAAAVSNMAVSVFGPSQNGKSFLVSVLARPDGKPLVTAFNDPAGELSYIRDINPEGEGESTGLVTRFTMTKPKTRPGYPVPLQMLSLADVAQMLINSFFMDGDKSEPEPKAEALVAHIKKYEARAGRRLGAISTGDMWEIADYIDRNFRSFAYANKLAPFFEGAAELAPKLELSDLAPFMAPLWGGYDEFTALFETLAQGLSALKFATEVSAPLGALIPRESSIIDVAQLHRIGKPGADTLDLALPDGTISTLPRPVVCALTAEFVLPMRDLPDEMFRQTDLLDFPGTRNRFVQPLQATFVDPKGGLGQLILRGKVAYLFDRYVEDQKINAMLLCIKNSNMESIDLPKLVENWVAMTQGGTPERRAQTACILFFCLTFFDIHLIDSAAAAGETTRFDKRLYQSIIEKFGSSNWVRNWTPGKQFKNTFWMRNPNFFVEALFDYDTSFDPPREKLKPEKAQRISELRQGCLAAPLVQDHFADPAAAWDAAMTENDGGVTYLKQHLKPVCNIARKLEQIAAQLAALQEEVIGGIESFYVSDNLDERRREKQIAADALIDELANALQNRSFGALLSAMMVDQDTIFDRMMRVPAGIRISNAAFGDGAGTDTAELISALRPRRSSQAASTIEPRATTAAPSVRTMTRPAFQADVAMLVWNEVLGRLKEHPRLGQEYGLSHETASSLVAELLHASRRTKLEERVRAALEDTSFGLTLDGPAGPASVIASEAINRFVSALGYDQIAEADRPKAEEPGKPPVAVFAARPLRTDVLDLPERPRPTLPTYWRDWVHCLDAMFEANASTVSGAGFDAVRNAALGRILRQLQGKTESIA